MIFKNEDVVGDAKLMADVIDGKKIMVQLRVELRTFCV